jgi:serine/threonine protein kinase
VPEKETRALSPAKGFSVSYVLKYQDLTRTKELGTGGFGVVYQGMWRNMDVAIKQLLVKNLSKDSQQEFEAEANIMANLRAQNIVQFYGYCMSPERCLVMEYMPRGSLDKVLHSPEPLEWTLRMRIAQDIASGVSFLHAEGIIHRDIKSLNVLLDEHFKAKLTDFGLSRVKNEAQSFSTHHAGVAGTLAWMAPELTFEEGGCTKASDMYSVGITLWELVSRRLPFQEVQKVATIPVKVNNGYRDKIPDDCPPKLKTLIPACWESHPKNRPEADTVVTYFKSDCNDFPLFLKSKRGHQESAHSETPVSDILQSSMASSSSAASSQSYPSSSGGSIMPSASSHKSAEHQQLLEQLKFTSIINIIRKEK